MRFNPLKEKASTGEVSIIWFDLARHRFQLHGARADGSVAFRRKLSRGKLIDFVASQPRCVVAMEACASAHHYWGRGIAQLRHGVKLVPPVYAKPFVKRQKSDTADAEAICEAPSRPTMRFVAVKGEELPARGMLFRTRNLKRLLIFGAMTVVNSATPALEFLVELRIQSRSTMLERSYG